MPGAYAHYRFGRQVLSTFSPRQKQLIGRFRRLYDMGLYGGDFLAYPGPLTDPELGKVLETFRSRPTGEMLSQAKELATTEGAKAYLCGLAAHRCLEDACADFWGKQENPVAAEGEFDRYLLELDGLPATYDRSAHMKLTRGETVTVSQFYAPATANQVYAAIRRMTRVYHALASPEKKPLLLFPKHQWEHRRPNATPTQEALRADSALLVRYTRAVKEFPEFLKNAEL